LVITLQTFFFPTLLASGGTRKYAFLNFLQAVGVCAACLIGIQFGVKCLVTGLIINSLIISIPALWFMRQQIGLSPSVYCRPCLEPAMASLFMIGVIYLICVFLPKATPLVVLLVCKLVSGAIAYLGFLLMFKRDSILRLLEMVGHAVGFSLTKPISIAPSLAKR
jgi:hypothetical protein